MRVTVEDHEDGSYTITSHGLPDTPSITAVKAADTKAAQIAGGKTVRRVGVAFTDKRGSYDYHYKYVIG